MQLLAILCLAAVALAKPQDYSQESSGPVTTVTERTFTIKGSGVASGAADKYYGSSGSSYQQGAYSTGYATGYTAAAPSSGYSFETVATAAPAYQTYQSYQAAPAYYQAASYQQAAPAYQTYQTYQAPAYYQAAAYQQAAPAYYQTAYQAPVVQTVAAPISYQAVSPAYSYGASYNYAPSVSQVQAVRSQNYDSSSYQGVSQTAASGETKIYKHVYAFAAPEEPATRARISVQAPVNKRKHYKLVFIKTPSQQTVVDSDITLPAQEEEKTLIYVLSKNQKQAQPEIRIKQQEASQHAKPEVFFLKYKNEAEAQAIASGAISGQSSGVPANGEIISDGSVSILGKSSNTAYNNNNNVVYNSGSLSGSNVYSNGVSGVSQYSVGTVGVLPAAPVTVAPVTRVGYNSAANLGSNVFSFGSYQGGAYQGGAYQGGAYQGGAYQGAGLGSSFYSAQQEPASVSIKVTTEAPTYASSTVSSQQE